jgi:hypothetical protein
VSSDFIYFHFFSNFIIFSVDLFNILLDWTHDNFVYFTTMFNIIDSIERNNKDKKKKQIFIRITTIKKSRETF